MFRRVNAFLFSYVTQKALQTLRKKIQGSDSLREMCVHSNFHSTNATKKLCVSKIYAKFPHFHRWQSGVDSIYEGSK